MTEREFATECVSRLQKAGFVAYFAGGCVRDELLGLVPADHDIATSATPDEVKSIFPRCVGVGASFGVIDVIGPRDSNGEWLMLQIATFRNDGNYSDGRRPDSVIFTSAEEDAKRRDFTVNGMFFDPITGEVIDFVGGRDDLKNKILRAIGDPELRFAEDKLRLLRAARMAARFELTIDPATFAAAVRMAPQITVVSAERIAEELRKMLEHRNRSRGVQLLNELNLMPWILPEAGDWLEPQTAEPVSFSLAFALLLRNCGPGTVIHACKRLRMSNEEIDRIHWLVSRRESLLGAGQLPNHHVYPILTHAVIRELLILMRTEGHAADAELCERIIQDTPRGILDPMPLITGNDLKTLGLKPGPKYKRILDEIRNQQLDGKLTTHEQAIAQAQMMGS